MKSSTRPSILAGLAVPWLFITTMTASPTVLPNTIQGQVRAILSSQQEAWNRGDIDGFMKGYARSTSTTFVSGDSVTRGWQTVLDRYRKKYSGRAKMGTLDFADIEITPLSAGSALVLGRWRLTRVKDQPHGQFTLVFRRLPEGWRIVHDHTSSAPEH